jgi:hypothetical protein
LAAARKMLLFMVIAATEIVALDATDGDLFGTGT